MPEISLRDYLNKLENALFAGSADEVIHHSRHILQFYPKNVAAYRYLGRALVHNARWEEGSAALRRILSVIPDDYTAHLSLSEAYDGLKRGDSAIWHLERAFEQQPNSRDLIEAVRAMYRRYRAVEPKIGLTSAAVARQHLANRRYDQAIETLRGAVSRTPDRVDLKLLLAQVLWETGDKVGGAESALDVLEVLPDCMEANVILTRLWLGEGRPSDAQRYLSRVESVDPYRALEIAQGDSPDDAFRLEELDYQRFAKTEASSARPDWLTQITRDSTAAPSTETDWNQWSSGMLSSAAAPAPDSEPAPISFGFDEESEVPNFDQYAAPDLQPVSDAQTQMPPIADDPMAWLRAAGVEVHDDETPEEITFDDDDFGGFDTASPTAWMHDEDDEAIRVEPTAPEVGSDPMAWMREAAPEMIDESAVPSAPPDTDGFSWIADDDIALPLTSDESDVPVQADLSWMQDESGVLSDAFAMEQLSAPEPATLQAPEQQFDQLFPDLEMLTTEVDAEASAIEDASFNFEFEFEPTESAEKAEPALPDWMHASSFDDDDAQEEPVSADEVPDWMRDASTSGVFDEARAEQTDAAPSPEAVDRPRTGLTGLLNSANLDWLNKPDEPEPAPSDAWMAMFDEQPPKSESVTDAPGWLLSIDEEQTAAPASQPLSAEMEFDMPSDKDFDWMPQSTPEGEERPNEQREGETDEFSFEPDFASPADPPPTSDMPDWFSALDTESSGSQPEPEPELKPVGNALEPDDLPDWLTDLESGERLDRDEAPVQPAAAPSFDWTNVEPTEAETPASAAAQPIGDDFSAWLTGINDEFKGEAETLGLSEELAAADDELVWEVEEEVEDPDLSMFGIDTGEESVPASGGLPDWLSELKPETPASEMENIEADPLMPDTSLDVTDDLLPIGLGDVEEEPEPLDALEPAAESDLSWLSAVVTGEEPEDSAVQDLDEMSDEPDAIFATSSEWSTDDLAASVLDLDDEFEDEFGEEDEEPAEPIEADLSFLELDDADDEFELESDAEPEAAAEATALPDWLIDMNVEPELKSDTLPVRPEDGVRITEELLPIGMGAVEPDPTPLDEPEPDVENADYLTVSGSSEGHEADVAKDFSTVEGETYDVFARNSEWATDDLAASVGPQTSVTNFDDVPAVEAEDAMQQSEGSEAADTISYAEETMPAEANVPDWLNAMVPGVDVDYDVEEDEPIEQEFVEEPALLQPDSSSAAMFTDADEFQWLTDIVDEETREIVPEAPPALPELPGASATSKPRFAFSRRPDWLKFSKAPAWAKKAPANENPPAADSQDDFPDWIDDDPDRNNDLPEWLK